MQSETGFPSSHQLNYYVLHFHVVHFQQPCSNKINKGQSFDLPLQNRYPSADLELER